MISVLADSGSLGRLRHDNQARCSLVPFTHFMVAVDVAQAPTGEVEQESDFRQGDGDEGGRDADPRIDPALGIGIVPVCQ